MTDFNDIAALLHVEEKLRAHAGKYANLLTHVRAALDKAEADHTPKVEELEEPAPDAAPPSNKTPDPVTNGDLRRPT